MSDCYKIKVQKKYVLNTVLGPAAGGLLSVQQTFCSGDSKTGKYMADDLIEAIDKLPDNTVFLVVLDGASACNTARRCVLL